MRGSPTSVPSSEGADRAGCGKAAGTGSLIRESGAGAGRARSPQTRLKIKKSASPSA